MKKILDNVSIIEKDNKILLISLKDNEVEDVKDVTTNFIDLMDSYLERYDGRMIISKEKDNKIIAISKVDIDVNYINNIFFSTENLEENNEDIIEDE